MKRSKLYRDGYNACLEGKDLTDCPFPLLGIWAVPYRKRIKIDDSREKWSYGWLAAREEIRRQGEAYRGAAWQFQPRVREIGGGRGL